MKICARCLTLHSDVDTCPACGSGLVPYGMWRRLYPAAEKTPFPGTADRAMPGSPGAAEFALLEALPPAEEKSGQEGVKFVLGIFLSSLAFFVAFIAAYIVLGLNG